MCSVMIDVPNEVLYETNMTSNDAERFARQMVALGYYTKNNVSIGYCAQIAGLTEEEFICLLGENQVDIFKFSDDEELLRDVANA